MPSNKCINCGTTLTSNTCKNCNTVYSDKPFNGDIEAYYGEITVNGTPMKCYIGDIEVYPVFENFGRLPNRDPLYDALSVKRKITLIEM